MCAWIALHPAVHTAHICIYIGMWLNLPTSATWLDSPLSICTGAECHTACCCSQLGAPDFHGKAEAGARAFSSGIPCLRCPDLRWDWARPRLNPQLDWARPLPHLHIDWAHLSPHLHLDWAHPSHICNGTGRNCSVICTLTGLALSTLTGLGQPCHHLP
jgi:hypothetical protein